MIKSAYIHIPFCTKRCNYCSFVSFETLTLKNIYIDALLREIKHFYKNDKLETLYIGGGTPSTLSIGDFEQILEMFNFAPNAEITVEINPNNVDKDYLQGLKNLGVNRLSIGVQVFDDAILKTIGRTHSSKDAVLAVKTAQSAGFDNISIDLIYGLPNQSVKKFEKSLLSAMELNIQHISLYGLKIEQGCNFFNNRPDFLPDDDFQADMYLRAVEILGNPAENAGQNGSRHKFLHYEISNFALNNYQSKHNLRYWNNESYYGFGVSAHGYQDGVRYSNESDIEKYLQNPLSHAGSEKLDVKKQLEEEIFLGFRKIEGINVCDINKKFGIDFEENFRSVLDKYIQSAHIEKTPLGYKLSTNGILLSNIILSEFIE